MPPAARRLGARGAWALTLSAVLTAAGCGSEAPIGGVNEAEAVEAGDSGAPPWVENANRAPGYSAEAYPGAPYGITRGATAANLEFAGWANPVAAAYDPSQSTVLSFSDFYDPDNTRDIEFLLVNAVAVWCGVCQQEYADLDAEGIYGQLRPRGVEMLGILFEDAEGSPPKYSDLKNWATFFNVEFPFVLDPSFSSSIYFDRSATPMNMLIDAKTMQIVWVITGYDPSTYQQLDQLLKQRGR
jgi:AhpC/TSA family